jgi:hypothetical protein
MANNERNYKMELQNIVNKCPQMQGLDWVFGDEHREVDADLELHLYHSYIIGFGNDKIVIIPVKILEQNIRSEEPIIATPSNIQDISRLGQLVYLKINGMPEAISYHSYAAHNINYETRMSYGKFQDVTAEYFSYDKPYKLLHRPIHMSQNRYTAQGHNDGLDGFVNLEQKESYKNYTVFIKNFIGGLQPSQRDNDNLVGGIKKLLLVFAIVAGIMVLSVIAMVIVAALQGR